MMSSTAHHQLRTSKRQRLSVHHSNDDGTNDITGAGDDGLPIPDECPSESITIADTAISISTTATTTTTSTTTTSNHVVGVGVDPSPRRRSARVATMLPRTYTAAGRRRTSRTTLTGISVKLEWDDGVAVNDNNEDDEVEDGDDDGPNEEEEEQQEEEQVAAVVVAGGDDTMPTLKELSSALRTLDMELAAAEEEVEVEVMDDGTTTLGGGPSLDNNVGGTTRTTTTSQQQQQRRVASLQALTQLYDWADVADVTFLQNFHSLGGICRVLEILVHFDNSKYRVGVSKAASVLGECLYLDERVMDPSMGRCIRDMGKMFVQVDGIETLINALSREGLPPPDGGGELGGGGYEVEVYVWTTLRDVTYLDVARGEMRRDQKVLLMDTALKCLKWLTTAPHDGRHHHRTLEFTLTTLTNLLESPGRLTGREYKVREALTVGLNALKPYFNKWRDHEDLAQSAVVFLGCYLDYKEGDPYDAPFDRTLFTGSDYKGSITICVHCLRYFLSNGLIVEWAFWMLKKMCLAVENARMETLGVVEIVGTILKSTTSPTAAKREARELLHAIYGRRES